MFVDIIKFLCSSAELVHKYEEVAVLLVLQWFIYQVGDVKFMFW